MENKRQDNNTPKEENDVRIGMSSIVGKVIGYCNLLLTEKKFRSIKFTAVGGAIGKLVNVVENLKVFHAGLNQSNFLTTVSYQAVDRSGKVFNERLHPKMEVNLSLDTIATPEQGFVQAVVPEEERKSLQALMDKRREERQAEGEQRPQRGGARGGRGQRGAVRGRGQRGGFRGGERGATRGFRGGDRGGFRGGDRGGFRGGERGGFRGGDRGGFRGQQRGGFRGGDRGGFRGNDRGGFRGQQRGGFRGERGAPRGNRGQQY
jgi:hypothetical protein